MASPYRRHTGGPQIEPLREAKDLRPTASPESIRSYDEKRSDYVERPFYGNNGWERLAHALSQFNPVLNQITRDEGEKFKKEQTALGKEMMQRNKLAWNEFIAKNPEYAGLNPHFERGYKAAELNTKGLEYQALAQAHYTASGLANETDPRKVREAMNAFTKDYLGVNVQRGGYDPDLYEENLYRPVLAAEASILSRHSDDAAKEHMRRAEELHGQNTTTAILGTLNSTPNIANPQVMNSALDAAAAREMAYMAEREKSGVPRTLNNAITIKSLLNLAKAEGSEGFGEAVLILADKIEIGTGTIGGLPEFKAAAKTLRDHWQQEKRQKLSEARAAYAFNKTVEHDKAVERVSSEIFQAVKEGREVTPEKMVELAGTKHMDVARAYTDIGRGLLTHSPMQTKTSQMDYAVDEQLILDGKYKGNGLEFIARYGRERGEALIHKIRTVRAGGDPATRALGGQDMADAYTFLDTQISAFFPAQKGKADLFAQESEVTKAYKVEARQRLRDETEIYVKTYMEKNKFEPSAADLRVFRVKKSEEIARSYQLRKMEHEERGGDTTQPYLIQHPDAPLNSRPKEFWQGNTVQYVDINTLASIARAMGTQDEANVLAGIGNRYGLTTQQVSWMLNNQFDLVNSQAAAAKAASSRKGVEEEKAAANIWGYDDTNGIYAGP